MSEYIERGALMDKIGERLAYLREKNGDYAPYTDGYEECYCEVEEAPAADVVPASKWIKCEDKLPPFVEDVLLLFESSMAVGYLREKHGSETIWDISDENGYGIDAHSKPLYWIPLPEALKMDGGDDDDGR